MRKGKRDQQNDSKGDKPEEQDERSSLDGRQFYPLHAQFAKGCNQGDDDIGKYRHLEKLDKTVTNDGEKTAVFTKKNSTANTGHHPDQDQGGEVET